MGRDFGSPWVGLTGFGLVAAVVGSVFLLRGPLETRRPDQGADALEALSAEEVVRARLWQDPLHAIETHWANSFESGDAKGTQGSDRPPPVREMVWKLEGADDDQVPEQLRESLGRLLLVVPMSGEPYAEDSENRRRQRHAVVSALTENDYVPREAGRLGYFTAPSFDRDLGSGANGSENGNPDGDDEQPENSEGEPEATRAEREIRVGFEYYTGALEASTSSGALEADERDRWRSILVLWLNEEDFQTCALERISTLAVYLDFRHLKAGASPARTVLVGPTTSGALKALREMPPAKAEAKCTESSSAWWFHASNLKEELHGESLEWTKDRRKRLRILSPNATVPLELLFPEQNTEKRGCLKARTAEAAWRADICLAEYLEVASFDSVVARDDVVLAAILEELRVRGAARPLVAIVSEQDSAYGRLLDDVVEELVGGDDEGGGDRGADGFKGFKVREYGYLAGVDGDLPPQMEEQTRRGASEDRASNAPGSPGRSSLIAKRHEEKAFGANQLDYVRRLAVRIARDIVAPGRYGGGGASPDGGRVSTVLAGSSRTVIVGVLGSDVYDKLLIVKALRERLPAATFFTTDLDARLTHPDDFRSTRNLIVGSPYGFTVEGLKGAPFRDSYQTATFRAVTLALQERLPSGGASPPPRLFEIGRTGAVAITPHRTGRTGETLAGRWASLLSHGDVAHVSARRSFARQAGEWLIVFAPLLVLVAYALASKRALPERGAELRRRARGRVARVGASMLVLAVLTAWFLRGFEPWPLLEGVNSLPTLVLYLTTLVYAYSAMEMIGARMAQAKMAIQDGWFPPSGLIDSGGQSAHPYWRRRSWLSNWRQDVPRGSRELPAKDAEECWRQYLAYSSRGARIARIVPPLLASGVVIATVVFIVSPQVPLLTRSYNELVKWVGFFTTVGVVSAIYFCDDALRLGRAMVRDVARHEVGGWRTKKPEDRVDQNWQTMKFLELYTDSVMPVAALPFVLLALLIVARSTLFEGWVWTVQILLLLAGLAVYVALQTLWFQREAVTAKKAVLWCLDRIQLGHVGERDEREVATRVEIVKKRIDGIQRGAFGPWTRHPIVHSLLLPSLAYGLVFLLEAGL